MASSAALTISSTPGVTLPGAKTSATDTGSGDSFADMLASVDAAMLMQGQAMAPVDQAAMPPATAETPATAEDEAGTDIETAQIPAAALPQDGIKPPQPSIKDAKDIVKDDARAAKDDDTQQQPANDNMNAAQPVPPIQQAPAAPVQAVAPRNDDTASADAVTAPQAANAAPKTAPQAAANDSEAEEGEAAAPQAADAAAPKQAAGKPARSDFKKALENGKNGNAPVPAADSGKDAKPADAKLAADAHPADVPAQSAPQANSNPQPDAVVPAVTAANATHSASAPAATTTAAHETATPAPHHAPNLESLAVNIAAKSQGGAKQFDIRLDPPELGRVEVRLSIDATGKAEAHLTADQPQTLDLLQKDASALTRALRDAGLDVNQDGLNFSLRQQQQQAGGQEQGHAQGGRTWRGHVPMQAQNETANAAGAYASRGLGLLDIKV